MGKVKHAKQRHDPYLGGKSKRNDNDVQTKFNDVITDMASLDASKRTKACSTLAGVYYFNVSNKANLDTLTSTNILTLLSMRLADSNNDVRKEAAIALHNLSECNERDVFNRILNVGLFQRAMSSVLEVGAVEVASGTFVEQLLFTISNTVINSPNAQQELARSGSSFIDFVVSLLNMNVPHNCVTAAAQLLCALTNVKTSTNVAAILNVESLVHRVWAFSRELNFQSSGNSTTLILIQCSEILCNAFLQSDVTNPQHQQLVQNCHLSEVVSYLVQLLGTIPASQSGEGVNGVGGLTLIKVVSNTLLNLIEPFKGKPQHSGAEGEEQEEVTSVDIEEARGSVIPSLRETERRKYQMTSELLDSRQVVSSFVSALSKVVGSVKAAIEESLVVTSTEGNEGEEEAGAAAAMTGPETQSTPMVEGTTSGATTTSIVITKQVLNALDCLEQLLSSHYHFTLFKSTCGEFLVEVNPLLEAGQYMLDLVGHITTTTANSTGNSSSSTTTTAVWSYAEDVSESAVKDCIVSATSSLLDFIGQLIRVSHNTTSATTEAAALPSLYQHWSEASLKALTLLLIRGTTVPLSEVALSAVMVIAAVGQQGEKVLAGQTSTGTAAPLRLSVPVSFHSLLTNALLRRLQDPNCYSQGSTSAGVKANLNLHQSSLLLMDGMFNAVIDLHSSDDLALLEQFKKLKSVEKLQQACSVFNSRMSQDLSRKLDQEEREKLEETWENINNFIEYKQDFIRKAK